MVRRADGGQIGVQIDKDPSGIFAQQMLAWKSVHFDAPPKELENVELYTGRIVVGIMPGDDGPEGEMEGWSCVVAMSEKHPEKKVHLVVTKHCFGDEDDNEFSGFPRVISFAELQEKGTFLGRFEGCTQSDIEWYMEYQQENHALPATGVSFPSADDYGPYGERGGYDEQGKAIKIKKVEEEEV
jgi:hypothetical protein